MEKLIGQVAVCVVLMTFLSACSDNRSNQEVLELQKQIAELNGKVAQLQQSIQETAPGYDQADPLVQQDILRRQMARLRPLTNPPSSPNQMTIRFPLNGQNTQAQANAPTVQDNDKNYVLTYRLPDIDQSKISVEVKDGVLLIQADRSSESLGKLSSIVTLPKGTLAEDIHAKYENGILRVTVNKRQESTAFQAPIKVHVE